jgi:carbonic anhydrase
VLRLTAGALAATAVSSARAAGEVEALVLACMDYRLRDDITRFLTSRGLHDNYDEVVLAGAALGASSDAYPHWRTAFSDHVELALKLHGIKRLVVIDHRDCGAYKLILGPAADRAAETAQHAVQMRKLAAAMRERHPALAVELLLMDLDGKVETIAAG